MRYLLSTLENRMDIDYERIQSQHNNKSLFAYMRLSLEKAFYFFSADGWTN